MTRARTQDSELIAALQSHASISLDASLDVIEHRKKVVKVPLTVRSATAISKELALCADPEKAIDHWLNVGWRGFKAEWLKRPSRFQDANNPHVQRQSSVPVSFDRKPAGPKPIGQTAFLKEWAAAKGQE